MTAIRADAARTRVIAPRVQLRQRLRDLWTYRELLGGLIRKELKVKYKNSVLGFAWSMLNPLMYLVIFYFVFQIVLGSGIPFFAIYLLSGLLVWNMFSSAMPAATGSIVGNASIVKKVAFPREILPLAAVGAALVHFFLQGSVLVAAMAVLRYGIAWGYLPLMAGGLIVLLTFTAAAGIFLAGVNVYLRDTQHLLELLLTAWFWMTPIVYAYRQVHDRLAEKGIAWMYLMNPLTPVVLTFQRGLYNKVNPTVQGGTEHLAILPADASYWWYGRNLLILGIVSLFALLGALKVFGRLEGNFAEEL